MQRLECHVKKYKWGKQGNESELWMGTHPDGPAVLANSSTRLSSFIAKSHSASYLSNNNWKEDIHLPFIMKVMSIARSLSLQAHPTKEQAARLHERDPIHYPDRHHKPELAYALTQFELLCGFRPAEQILANIEEMMEKARNHPDLVGEYHETLGKYSFFPDRGCITEGTVEVIRKMYEDFPGDIGIFSPLILNHMVLKPGECCYYAAEELHAYLSGGSDSECLLAIEIKSRLLECVECVGCSNNTIRAAMTPKFIDRDALCEVLNYRMTPPEDYLVPANPLPDYPGVEEYSPDCKDFQLHRIRVCLRLSEEWQDSNSFDNLNKYLFQVQPTAQQASLPVLNCASIMVIVDGSAVLEEVDGPSSSRSKVRKMN
ncbi:unnamed protein product [Strongylus vulgaris]|uniref:mannose-6-phosphate isomerase n=1 Tax=Strongylus vulgaris TaxID=40348 RepID=A0A3P7JAQ3_STRVU|nr:unnamed protein product [Strongylus vulgaris]